MNKVILAGILTQDAVLNALPSGINGALLYIQTVTTFGDRQEVAVIEVKAWSKNAELALATCKKGMFIALEGRLKVDSWLSKETGKTLTKLNIVAERIHQAEASITMPPMMQEAKRISPQQEAYSRNLASEFAPQPQKNITSNLLDSGELPF